MKFDALSLRRFKCYNETGVSLGSGVTVVYGPNGSGKSTLLDGAFFALYGSDSLAERTLDEVITTGEDEAAVELQFTHGGTTFDIRRELALRGDRAQTTHCTLTGGDRAVDGARAVQSTVADLLRMDADAFLNCAYVRQGEVNKLIHASPSSRQDMIDELLQLGRLEEYRDRATSARRAVATIADEVAGQVTAIDEQIADKEAKDLPETINQLETARSETESQLDSVAKAIEDVETTRTEAEGVIDQFEERRDELDAIEQAIEELRDAITEAETDREAVTDEIASITEERAELQEQIRKRHQSLGVEPAEREAAVTALEEAREEDASIQETLEEVRVSVQKHRSKIERATDRVEEYRERAAQAENEAESLHAEIESSEEKVAERRSKLESLIDERESAVAAIEDAGFDLETIERAVSEAAEQVDDYRDREQEKRATITALEQDIEEAERLLDAGRCPTCGQEIHEAPPVESLEEDRARLETLSEELDAIVDSRAEAAETLERRESLLEHRRTAERLADRIDSAESLIDEVDSTLADLKERKESLIDEAESASEDATEAAERAEAARSEMEEATDRVAAANERRQSVQERIQALEELLDWYDELESFESTLAELRTRRNGIDELNEERRDRLQEHAERRAELAADLDEERVRSARQALENAEDRHAELVDQRTSLESKRDELLDRLGRVRNELDELDELRVRREEMAERLAAIESAHEDANTLESMYGDLRADLRERNVTTLERLLNETFGLVYQNDAYDRIDLDREYRMTVYQKDGEPLAPEQLSGGERALFNLSLRCAIYRLLAEGIDGTAPLPPLILDEPTVYLDDGHVGKLVELIDAMRSLGVEQIVVVSHDDELLRAADSVLKVEKDPTTNRSTVTRSPAVQSIAQD